MANALAGDAGLPEPEHWDYSRAWYHGSPQRLTVLFAGSTITQEMALARAFSHKPQIVSIDDEAISPRIRHNGILPGLLYRIDEPLGPFDIIRHPNSSMAPGLEWVTRRPLRLVLVEVVKINPDEWLTDAEIARIISTRKPAGA